VPDGTVPETPVDEQRPPRPSWYRRLVVLVPLGLLALLALGYGADLALAGDDIPRGTSVSGAAIGGLDRSAAEGVLREEVAPELTRDRDVTAGSVELTATPVDAGIGLDVDATLDAAGGQPLNPLTRLVSLFGGERDVAPVLAVDDAALTAAIEGYAAEVDLEPVEGTITIEGTTAVAVPPVEMSSTPSLESPAAKSVSPVLSETLRIARISFDFLDTWKSGRYYGRRRWGPAS